MSLLNLIGVCVLLLEIHHSKSELRFTDPILFDFYHGHKLNVTNAAKTQATKAKNMMGCLSNCVPVNWCKSVNLKTKSGEDGLHLCELLSSDRFTKVNNLTEDVAYDHLNLKKVLLKLKNCHCNNFQTPCEVRHGKPCYNGGKCILKDSNYTCKCHGKFSGEFCNIDGLWSSWGPWTCPCPQTRSRTCQNPVTASLASDCTGQSHISRECTTIPNYTISGCDGALGMEDGRIPDERITASSSYKQQDPSCLPKSGRLNGPEDYAWCSGTLQNLGNDFLQVDLGIVKNVTKIATQGRKNGGYLQWVNKYSISYSNDATSWTLYTVKTCETKMIINGNTDSTSVVKSSLPVPIEARFIRVIPLSFQVYVSMKIELYGC